MKIGYAPYAPDLNSACDRRRFPYYARLRGFDFDVFSPDESYDLVIISSQADFSYWKMKPVGCPVILDMADGYLSHPLGPMTDRIKAIYKYVRKDWSGMESSFTDTFRLVAKTVDAVVCASHEQRQDVSGYNPRVYDILDFHSSEFSDRKTDYTAHRPFRLVWEGVGDSLYGFSTMATALKELSLQRPVELHILTDLRFRRMNQPFSQCSARLVEGLLPGVNSYLYQWNRSLFGEIVRQCDLAVIPMLVNSPMVRVKPENRLLLFWKLGMPVLAADTLAYERVLSNVGLKPCSSQAEWLEELLLYIDNEECRRTNVEKGADYIERLCSDEKLAASWDAVISSLS